MEQQVKRIEDKLQQLLRRHEILLKENEKLKAELREFRSGQGSDALRLDQLQQQVEILRATKGGMNDQEKKVLEKRLSQYIREIDRCITLLGE